MWNWGQRVISCNWVRPRTIWMWIDSLSSDPRIKISACVSNPSTTAPPCAALLIQAILNILGIKLIWYKTLTLCFSCYFLLMVEWTTLFCLQSMGMTTHGERGRIWIHLSCSIIILIKNPHPWYCGSRAELDLPMLCHTIPVSPGPAGSSCPGLWPTLNNRREQSCLTCLPCSHSASSCCLIHSGWKLEHLARK